jgi:hypothetical protein
MKRSTIVLLILNIVVWGGMALLGRVLLIHEWPRPGRSDIGQMEGYLAFPLIMLFVSTFPAASLSRTQWAVYGNAWSVITLLVLLPYGCVYTGGM